MRPQGVVGGDDVILHQVPDHRTASCGRTTAPVNVDPVVPVSRTGVVLAHGAGGRSSSTSWLPRVRAEHEIAAPGRPLDQHLVGLAHPGDVLAANVGPHRVDEPLEPRGRHLVATRDP